MEKLSKALTWDDLANEYNKHHSGRGAQTLPMESIFDWAASQIEKFKVDDKEGTIHLIIKN